jgi:DNA-binding SARP family transcriptional activator
MDYRLLGPLEVRVGDEAAALGGPRQRAVLTVLLLRAGEVVSQDALIDQVWGERPPGAAVAQVHNCVARLRRALGAEVLVRRPPGYVLHARPEEIDSRRFEHAVAAARALEPAERAAALREALSMWRGAALADLAYEPFAAGEAARLEELRLIAVEERIEAELELGRHAALVAELEALVARHPLRERLRAAQMLALYRSRRKPDALQAFQDARLALLDELGLEPSEELRGLERRIHADDPSLEPPSPAMQAAAAPEIRRPGVVVCIESEVMEDPETNRRVVEACAEAARLAVERHGGSVRQLLGEEVIAFFGLAAVHEDDALRATRAAVEVRDAFAELGAPARIGLAAGEVLAGGDGAPLPGAALRQARRLKDRAGPGTVMLAPAVLQLVGSSVDAVPDAEGFRLLRLEPTGARPRFEAPFVGRAAELARLEGVVADAASSRRSRRVVLVGDPGVGKSRLAREVVRSFSGRMRVLIGRCAAYGEGARYAPLAEVLRGALDRGDAVPDELVPLLDDGVPTAPSANVFRAVRLVLEAAAPVLLVLDDAQWAAPMLHDLVDYLVSWGGELPVALLCVARPELLEARRSWEADALILEPLADDDAGALVRLLAPQEDERRLDGVLRAAEGNPLFLEQLVAFEGGKGELPPTLETLLASRLDRLSPDEREALCNAAVVGPEFGRSAIESLVRDAARPAVPSRLASLVRQRFLRPAGEDGFAFRHALIRDAAYASLTKESRAGLHESLAVRLVAADDVIGFHLEHAHGYFSELGVDRDDLARSAAAHLGDAGIAAFKRSDIAETVQLLSRAVRLLPEDDPARLSLACELGTALKSGGEMARAEELLAVTAEIAAAAGLERVTQRAQIELVWPRMLRGASVAEAVRFAESVIAALEHDGDDRSRERAWLVLAALHGPLQGRHAACDRAAEQALHFARLGGFSIGAPLSMLAANGCDGPTPVDVAIDRCEQLLREAESDRAAEAGVLESLGHLLAMRRDAVAARSRMASARSLHVEFGFAGGLTRELPLIAAEVEVLAGDDAAAEAILGDALASLEQEGDRAWASTVGARLAEVLAEAGRGEEALALCARAAELASPDDIRAQASRRRAQARALGDVREAEELARQAIALLEGTDELNEQARAYAALADVLRRAGRGADAAGSMSTSSALLAAKGNEALRGRLAG